MRREIRRLEINEGIHLEGIGIISSVLPMALKHVDVKMFYDTTYPGMILIEAKGVTHFITVGTVKSGTFDGQPNGNVLGGDEEIRL
jgi:hypothetical protein